jgi:uncharacterized membrane protein
MWGFGWGFMFFGPLCMIFLALAIYFIFVSSSRRGTHGHCGHNGHHGSYYASQGRAIEVLNERYAKGEITREQFLEMRKTIVEN